MLRDHERFMWADASAAEKLRSAKRFDAALADLDALVQAANEITYAIWENEPEEIASAERFRAALARVKGEQHDA